MMQTKTLLYFCTFALYAGKKAKTINFRLLKAVVLTIKATWEGTFILY